MSADRSDGFGVPDSAHPVCFTCGQVTSPEVPPARLPGGEPCPACLDRYTDSLPALLPRLAGQTRTRRRTARATELRALRRDIEPRTGTEPNRPA